jgi:hypothetical protein
MADAEYQPEPVESVRVTLEWSRYITTDHPLNRKATATLTLTLPPATDMGDVSTWVERLADAAVAEVQRKLNIIGESQLPRD